MRKQIIKFLFLLLAFGYATEAKSGEFTVDDIWYYYTNEDDDEVGVMYSKSGEYSGDVVIPSTVTYNGKQYTVTSIGSKAFSGCTRLKKVTIGRVPRVESGDDRQVRDLYWKRWICRLQLLDRGHHTQFRDEYRGQGFLLLLRLESSDDRQFRDFYRGLCI